MRNLVTMLAGLAFAAGVQAVDELRGGKLVGGIEAALGNVGGSTAYTESGH